MAKKISKFQEFIQKQKEAKKVVYFDDAKNISIVNAMNEQMEIVRREFHNMDKRSLEQASKVILSS